MKKIPTIFVRDPENRSLVLNEINPVCQWVFDGCGKATRKYDGTCVKIENGQYYKRREVKPGKTAPAGFIEEEADPVTGKRVGWVEVDPDDPSNRYHVEAWDERLALTDGTYELVGPKVQGNPEKYPKHTLIKHSEAQEYYSIPRTFLGIAEFLKTKDIEGLVFHHPDGRMGKIKKRDFGQRRTE